MCSYFNRIKLQNKIQIIQISSIKASKSDENRFYIFTGIKTLHLRAKIREDRKAWIDVLRAAKESFLLVGLAQLQNPNPQNLHKQFRKDFKGVDSNVTLGFPTMKFVQESHNFKLGDHGSFLLALENSPSRLPQQKPWLPVQNYILQKPTNDGSIEIAKLTNADLLSKLCSSAKGNSSRIGAK